MSDNYIDLIEEARQMAEDESEDFVVNRLAAALESVVRDRNEARAAELDATANEWRSRRYLLESDRFWGDTYASMLTARAAAIREEEN